MISFDDVTKLYPSQTRPALQNVSVEVEKGEFIFLVGASGSGKSTFIRLVLREERSTGGDVHVAGKELGRLSSWKVPQLRRQIGCVFQDFRLLPNKNVRENVAFALEVLGKNKRLISRWVPETLELVGLDGKADRLPDELSGGEQQRVAIARALANGPQLLLEDEPTGQLDSRTGRTIMDLIRALVRSEGVTAIVATHDPALIDVADRLIELRDGEIVTDSDADVLTA